MAVDLELAPKRKRPAGERCCDPVVYPDVERAHAVRMAAIAKALGDPIRLQLVDELRRHAGKVCVCELVPLFDVSQPTLSHHRTTLREAGIVDSERRGLWAYYYVVPAALKPLPAWLSWRRTPTSARWSATAMPPPRSGSPTARPVAGAGRPATPRRAAPPTRTSARPTRPARRCSAPPCTASSPAARRPRRSRRRSAAACPPRSPSSTRARPSSTSARAPAPTC